MDSCYVKYDNGRQCPLRPQFQVDYDKSCFKHLPQLVKLASSERNTLIVTVEVLL